MCVYVCETKNYFILATEGEFKVHYNNQKSHSHIRTLY